jgi:hypothetical protein
MEVVVVKSFFLGPVVVGWRMEVVVVKSFFLLERSLRVVVVVVVGSFFLLERSLCVVVVVVVVVLKVFANSKCDLSSCDDEEVVDCFSSGNFF